MTINGDRTATTITATNVASMFRDRVQASSDNEAFRYLVAGEWVSATWQQTADRVEMLSAGLLALGIEPEQRVGIASSTRYEWIPADLAIMCSGAATTTVYPTINAGGTAYILADSESRVVFAEDAEQLAKLTERRAELPSLIKVVLFEGDGDGDWAITLADLAELGQKYLLEHPSGVQTRTDAITPQQLATLIYTSGTTGPPKGVRLPHSAWAYEGTATVALNLMREDDLQLLWLPMAHAFGKVLVTAQLACGFVTAIDGRVDKIVDNMAVLKPTVMGAAPRIFEKAHARIVTTQQAQGGLRARLFAAAFTVGLAMEGTSIRINDDDGEIQIRGACVMDGYHNLPDQTAETFTDDGWLRSGDMGVIDADGFLTVTGRIKEMFKTSAGKYVVPPAIEAKFMALCPYVSRFLVVGEGRNFCVALIALDADLMSQWAAENGLDGATYQDLVKAPAVREMVGEYIAKLNSELNRWETIKKWVLLDHDLSIERGELTPSLKVKRSVVAEQNKQALDALYT